MVEGNGCLVDWEIIFAAIWLMSLLERLGIGKICSYCRKIQDLNPFLIFKRYHHYPSGLRLDEWRGLLQSFFAEKRAANKNGEGGRDGQN